MDHVGALRPADDPDSQGTVPVQAVLLVLDVVLSNGVPVADEIAPAPQPPGIPLSHGSGVVRIGRPVDSVRGMEEVDLHAVPGVEARIILRSYAGFALDHLLVALVRVRLVGIVMGRNILSGGQNVVVA